MSSLPRKAQARLDSLLAGASARLDNLAFDMRRAAEAIQDFGDAYQIAVRTPEAEKAGEVAEAVLARANLRAKSVRIQRQ